MEVEDVHAVRAQTPQAPLDLAQHVGQAVQEAVSHFFGDGVFEIVRGAMPGVPHKPDPASALQISAELGLDAGEFLYVGDTNTDMQTAVAAGMYPVGATWGFRPAEELTGNGARQLVQDPRDILRLL